MTVLAFNVFQQQGGKMKKHQSGFTLVEIAIVLVIIGLLLGGVLKGQAMIESAKIRNVTNDLNAVQTAFHAYQDRYRAMPGDDAAAITHFGAGVTNGGGNGAIAGAYTLAVPAAAGESSNFWQHVRSAGFMKGEGTSGVPPFAATGGILGVEAAPLGLTGTAACVSIESSYAQSIDAGIDDGVATSGDVRAGATYAALNGASGAAADYAAPDPAKPYVTLCKKI
ncbi:MAG: prepilin-type N-terminal cleavage/methylation domain-containing protein [Sulfuricella sp.]|nr:prepilin-type N-terminal cleavage/methylation domain-containing protein [Sulfuricella sp.]